MSCSLLAMLTTGESFGLNQVGGAGAVILVWKATSQGRILDSASYREAASGTGRKRDVLQ